MAKLLAPNYACTVVRQKFWHILKFHVFFNFCCQFLFLTLKKNSACYLTDIYYIYQKLSVVNQ